MLDACAMPEAVVAGFSMGAWSAMQFAADYTDRTSALVVVGASARFSQAPGYDHGVPADAVETVIEHVVAAWGTGASVEAEGPTMAGDDRYRGWAARLERHTISPGGFEATLRAVVDYDVRPLLPRITSPTLVVHRTDDQGVAIGHGRYLADHVADATFAEVPGVEHTYFLGQQGIILDVIREFVDDHVAGGTLRAAVRRAERKSAYGSGWDALTPGEREVAVLVAQGLTNAEVAVRLGASPFTVDGRLRRVFAKLNVSTRVELTADYLRISAPR